MTAVHEMPFGAQLRPDGATRFRLWAPAQERIELEIAGHGDSLPMQALAGGWHELDCDDAPAGSRYRFRLGDGRLVPDPAARANEDVNGCSIVVDPRRHPWQDAGWRGRPWEEAVVYELHVGVFTSEGTYRAAAERLDDLAELGITAIELMPLAEFAGARNWGYDGVLPFAPESAYGSPDELKALVDGAHARGLMVLLDVVYNHFGPEGNHLGACAPAFFDAAAQTPWGPAINFDGPGSAVVRSFFVHNALYWLEEFRFDGLRLDAVHAIRDRSARHLVAEIAAAIAAGPGRERRVHLVLENDANDARLLAGDRAARAGLATAQWNDDVHHLWHVLLTGETDGYYADYAERTLAKLGRALAEGYAWQGEPSPFRGGEPRGSPSAHLPPAAFVNFLQNHDQIGNRAFGERLEALVLPERAPLHDAALACLLLGPQVPMLFMGEEWGCRSPFLYFCDFGQELARAVREGRRGEFARFATFTDPRVRETIPDPNHPRTFATSGLDWSERGSPASNRRLERVRTLLAIRRIEITPWLEGARSGRHAVEHSSVLRVAWPLGGGRLLHLLACLGEAPIAAVGLPPGRPLHADKVRDSPDGGAMLSPGSVFCSIEGP